ncbi:MAG: hypothetical protein ACFFDN_13060, partial [Candidatus Hodarchaeota archaeon]
MSINKIYDACIIIRFLEEIKFKILFEEWYKNSAYNQCTTSEVLDEIEREARNELNDLISKNIIKVLNPVPDRELTRINLLNPNLSKADCSLFYYLEILPNCICLTDDFPLRLLCIEESIETKPTHRYDIDALRVLATILLIIFHTAMLFAFGTPFF